MTNIELEGERFELMEREGQIVVANMTKHTPMSSTPMLPRASARTSVSTSPE